MGRADRDWLTSSETRLSGLAEGEAVRVPDLGCLSLSETGTG